MSLTKTLAGAAAGIFVGALIMEVLHRTKPEFVEEAGEKVLDAGKKAVGTARTFTEAFLEGYKTQSEPELELDEDAEPA